MLAGSNLLLIPAAIAMWQKLRGVAPERILLYTISGILSMLFWAYGGASHGITPTLEIVYLLLSGVWWIGIGSAIRKQKSKFGVFTLILGLFAMLDAVLSFFEPMPFYIYVLASPKLPISIIWDFWIAITLLKEGQSLTPTILPLRISPGFSAGQHHSLGGQRCDMTEAAKGR